MVERRRLFGVDRPEGSHGWFEMFELLLLKWMERFYSHLTLPLHRAYEIRTAADDFLGSMATHEPPAVDIRTALQSRNRITLIAETSDVDHVEWTATWTATLASTLEQTFSRLSEADRGAASRVYDLGMLLVRCRDDDAWPFLLEVFHARGLPDFDSATLNPAERVRIIDLVGVFVGDGFDRQEDLVRLEAEQLSVEDLRAANRHADRDPTTREDIAHNAALLLRLARLESFCASVISLLGPDRFVSWMQDVRTAFLPPPSRDSVAVPPCCSAIPPLPDLLE